MLKNRIRSITVQWAFALVLILSAVSPVAAQKEPDPNIALIAVSSLGPQGDANLDGIVDAADIMAVARHILGIEQLSPQGVINANVNCDDRISSKDISLIRKFILYGKSFPC